MDGGELSGLAADGLWLALGFAIPLLVGTALVSWLGGALQSLTQTREASLLWTARFAAAACILWMMGAWVWQQTSLFATELWTLIVWVGQS